MCLVIAMSSYRAYSISAYGHWSTVWGSQQMMYLNMATQRIKNIPNIVQSTRLAFIYLYNCDYVFRLAYRC